MNEDWGKFLRQITLKDILKAASVVFVIYLYILLAIYLTVLAWSNS